MRRGRKSPPLRLTRFPTAWRDPNGLIYLRLRFYHPGLGLFLSRDPVEGVLNRPMSLNGYSYVEGNPVNRTDPSGEFPWLLLLAIPLLTGGLFAANNIRGQIYAWNMRGYSVAYAFDHLDLKETAGSFGRGALFAGGVELGIVGAAMMPGATLAYLGATAAYTIAGNTLGVSGWAYDALGILTGMGFIRNDYNFITTSNANWEEKLQAVGDAGFNLMLGSALFSGLSRAGRAIGLSRRLAAVTGETIEDVAAGRTNVLLDEAKTITGMDYSINPLERKGVFFRHMGTTTIDISKGALSSPNTSRLAGNFLHEVTHGMQEFGRTGTFMKPFLEWSANTLPFAGDWSNQIRQLANLIPGYLLNPVELGASAAGLGSISINWLLHLPLRTAQALFHDPDFGSRTRCNWGLSSGSECAIFK